LRAGKLRHHVTIQKPKKVRSKRGAETITYVDDFKAWADIDPPKGREYFADGQKQSAVVTRVVMRYRKGVTPQYRVKHGTRIFHVNSVVNPDERNRELILMCSEAV